MPFLQNKTTNADLIFDLIGDEKMLLDDTLREDIRIYLEIMLAFNSIDHDLIWKYIVVVASQLEYNSIRMLLISDREDPRKFCEYEEHTTLNQAVDRLE